ncbi:hypothetical protein SDJN02_18302, partial [Cucurbita argyrosperma subsp. argyrosperma]
ENFDNRERREREKRKSDLGLGIKHKPKDRAIQGRTAGHRPPLGRPEISGTPLLSLSTNLLFLLHPSLNRYPITVKICAVRSVDHLKFDADVTLCFNYNKPQPKSIYLICK